MGKTTVAEIVAETVVAIWEELQPIHMPVPSEENLRSVAEDFLSIWNFPNCVGAIDGKHVPIRCPSNSGSMFFNYKKFFSVILQGVSDANYRFTNIDVGGYGKQSDGGTFQASELYRALTDGKINLPKHSFLPQTNVMAPYVLIGDEAYPLLPFVLKPYSGTNLPLDKECFNKRLSRARKTIECAFGLLTSKWRVLAKGIETRVDMVDSIVKCVCILHNTVIDKDGFQPNLTEVSVRSVFWQNSGRPTNEAKSIRDIFTTYFAHNPLTYE